MIEKSGSVAIVQSTKRRSQKPGGSHKPMTTSFDMEKRLAFIREEECRITYAKLDSLMACLAGRNFDEFVLFSMSENYAAHYVREKYGHNTRDMNAMIDEAQKESANV